MLRRIPSKQRNAPVARERDRGVLFRLSLLLVCGLTLAGGFVYAGGQHFAALRLGYQTENLRKVRSDLAEEKNRYMLEREEATSPARLERAARQLGMQPLQATQIDPLKTSVKSPVEQITPAASSTRASAARNAQTELIKQPTSKRTEPIARQSVSVRTR
jgi:cell division protein FtsL